MVDYKSVSELVEKQRLGIISASSGGSVSSRSSTDTQPPRSEKREAGSFEFPTTGPASLFEQCPWLPAPTTTNAGRKMTTGLLDPCVKPARPTLMIVKLKRPIAFGSDR